MCTELDKPPAPAPVLYTIQWQVCYCIVAELRISLRVDYVTKCGRTTKHSNISLEM